MQKVSVCLLPLSTVPITYLNEISHVYSLIFEDTYAVFCRDNRYIREQSRGQMLFDIIFWEPTNAFINK